MNTYTHVKVGNRFVLTALGFEVGYVRAKYNSENPTYNKYQHVVPSAWVQKGYVVEVPEVKSDL